MTNIGIIGGGPAGYSAAIRAKQYGFDVVLFEKSDMGGTCLNKGCIPTKSILHSSLLFVSLKNMIKNGISIENPQYDYSLIKDKQVKTVEKIRKSLTKLVSDYGITIINEEAQIFDGKTVKTQTNEFTFDYLIIATGSKPNHFKFNGSYDTDFVMTSDDILNLTQLPDNVTIIGSGAIGIEWTRIFSALNKKVNLIELAPKIIPLADNEVSERVERILKRNKVDFYTNTTIETINDKKIKLTNGKEFETDKVLVAIGRSPVIPNFESQQPEISKYIVVNENFETSLPNVFAVGDVNGKSMLAHSATNQALQVIEYIKTGKKCEFNSNYVPSVIYGTPEIASFGVTEQNLINSNTKYKKSVFPYAALGKAQADDNIEGFIKILSVDDKIVGAHIIGEEASALIQQVLISAQNEISIDNLTKIIFPHPTYSEGILETLEGLNNLAINIPQNKL